MLTRAALVTHPGPPEVLGPGEVNVADPAADELRIRVEAAGVNRADLLQRAGRYPPPEGASPLLGLEVAGTVESCGADAADAWPRGTRVAALVAGGGYAELCLAPAAHAFRVPDAIDAIGAAALPEALFTVWYNAVVRCQLAPGEWLLVHGGTSGIGVVAIQLARALGAHVLVTAGSDAKCERARALGADVAVSYHSADFVAAARDATDGRGVDVILDMVGGTYVARNLAALAADGRLVNIAYLEGSVVALDLAPVMTKRLTVTGSTMRRLPRARKDAVAGALRERVWPWVADGTIRPVVDSVFPLADAAGAHRRMEHGGHVGKIVLVP